MCMQGHVDNGYPDAYRENGYETNVVLSFLVNEAHALANHITEV